MKWEKSKNVQCLAVHSWTCFLIQRLCACWGVCGGVSVVFPLLSPLLGVTGRFDLQLFLIRSNQEEFKGDAGFWGSSLTLAAPPILSLSTTSSEAKLPILWIVIFVSNSKSSSPPEQLTVNQHQPPTNKNKRILPLSVDLNLNTSYFHHLVSVNLLFVPNLCLLKSLKTVIMTEFILYYTEKQLEDTEDNWTSTSTITYHVTLGDPVRSRVS